MRNRDIPSSKLIAHRSILQTIVAVSEDHCPKSIVKYCSLDVLSNIIRTLNHTSSPNEVVMKVDQALYPTLVDRILEEVNTGNGIQMSVHPCLCDSGFLVELFRSERHKSLYKALYQRYVGTSLLVYVVTQNKELHEFVRLATQPGLFNQRGAKAKERKWVGR